MLLEEEQVTYFARWLKKKKKSNGAQNPGNRCRAACVWLAHSAVVLTGAGDPSWASTSAAAATEQRRDSELPEG